MSTAPVQRAMQQPIKAAMAAQRVLGRAVQNIGEAVPPYGVALLDGQYYDVDLTKTGAERLKPRGKVNGHRPPKPPKGDPQPDHGNDHQAADSGPDTPEDTCPEVSADTRPPEAPDAP